MARKRAGKWPAVVLGATLGSVLTGGAALAAEVSATPIPGSAVHAPSPFGFPTPGAHPAETDDKENIHPDDGSTVLTAFVSEAEPCSGSMAPPSPHGAVGPAHIVTVSSDRYRIFDRRGAGTVPSAIPSAPSLLTEVDPNGFWSGVLDGGSPPSDSRVLYDAPSDTWYIVAISRQGESGSSRLLIAEFAPPDAYTPSDPTGSAWTRTAIDAGVPVPNSSDPSNGTIEPSFVQIGVSAKWLAVTAPMQTAGTTTVVGQRLWLFPKKVATGTAGEGADPGLDDLAHGYFFPVNFAVDGAEYPNPGVLSPSQCMDFHPVTENTRKLLPGPVSYGAEADLYFVDIPNETDVQQFRISKIAETANGVVWTTDFPHSAAHGLVAAPEPFNGGAQPDAPQPDDAHSLEVGDAIAQCVVLRRGVLCFTSVGGLPHGEQTDRVGCLWTEVDTRSVSYDYEDPDTRGPVTGGFYVTGGVVDGGEGVWSWRPSLATNSAGEICLGFTQSSATTYPSACYILRPRSVQPGHDGSTLLSQVVVRSSTHPYARAFAGRYRWGECSATVVDAADDACFWTIQEYATDPLASGGRWSVVCTGIQPEAVTVVGPDTANPTTPKIQPAIDLAQTGDTILVRDGRYAERIRFFGADIEVRTPRPYDMTRLWSPGFVVAAGPGAAPQIPSNAAAIGPAAGANGTAVGTVVRFNGEEPFTTVLAGFIVMNGNNANASRGGGVANTGNLPSDPSSAGTKARIAANLFYGNVATERGAALFDCDGDVVTNDFVSNSTASASGGALSLCDGKLRGNAIGGWPGNTFPARQGNTSSGGGGIAGGVGVHVDDVIGDNTSSFVGGAVWSAHGSFTNCTIAGNVAVEKGGAFSFCEATVTGCRVSNNHAGSGGAFDEQKGEVSGCAGGDEDRGPIIFDNRAVGLDGDDEDDEPDGNGSGGAFFDSTCSIQNCTMRANKATFGGAIWNHKAPGSISDSLFWDNGKGGSTPIGAITGGAIGWPTGSTEAVAIDGCTFEANKASGNGGAIVHCSGQVSACTFSDNDAAFTTTFGDGGAIADSSGDIIDCSFSYNTARNGGALAGCAGTVDGCTFFYNSASADGGAVARHAAVAGAEIRNCGVYEGYAVHAGGAFFACGTTPFTSVNVERCDAGVSGGAFHDCDGTVTDSLISDCSAISGGAFSGCNSEIVDCTVTRNSANFGGAFASCNLWVHHASGSSGASVVTSNQAGWDGGAFYYCGGLGSHGIADDTVVSFNSAGGNGGAFYGCSAPITYCEISGNMAYGSGGAAFGQMGNIERNRIFGNSAGVNGGAIAQSSGGIRNNAIHSNVAIGFGGGLYSCPGQIVNNTIVLNASPFNGAGMKTCTGTIRNNILAGNGPGGTPIGMNAPLLQLANCSAPTFCCVPGISPGSGNQAGTPVFKTAPAGSPAAVDLHQLPASISTINLGDPSGANLTPDDLDFLNVRPLSGRQDIGAYEQ